MSGWASRIIRKPARTRPWSSAMRTLVGRPVATDRSRHGAADLGRHRKPGADGVAAAEPWAGLEPPADERRSLAHPLEPSPAAVASCRRRPGAVIEDLEPDLGGLVGEVDDRPRPARVAEGVRERLLGDPVDGDVEARRQGAPLSVDLELGGKSRRLDALDEYRDAIDTRLRTEASGIIGRRRRRHRGPRGAPQLPHRLPPRRLDGEERLLGPLRRRSGPPGAPLPPG